MSFGHLMLIFFINITTREVKEMEFQFPKKVTGSQGSLIRDIAEKGKTIPEFVSFAIGNPAKESIPTELLQECVSEIFTEDPMAVFQYGPMVGEASLAAWIKNRVVTTKGCAAENNKVLLLAGSGKALGLVPRTLLDNGDEAYCDAYTFPNSFNSIKNVGGVPVAIPMDEQGMIPEALEKAAQSGKGKYVYLIPNFQNPTGATMPLSRRKELYDVACKYNLIIYEDDPYGEIRFKGEQVPTIKSIDTENRVLYVGSFSKTLSAGLRVGFVYGPDAVIQIMGKVKSADGQDPVYNQKIIMRCLEKMDYDEHLKKISQIYGAKCKLMLDGLKEHCSKAVNIIEPEGGMFIWVNIPEQIDINAMSDAALAAGVGVVKSEAFATDGNKPGHGFRLNFSAPTDEAIVKGTRIFGEITKQFCGE